MSSPEVPKLVKTRRSHKKSRRGCLECKRRRLKCGEEKPACAGCDKRKIQCDYLSTGPSHSKSPENVDTSSSGPVLSANQDQNPYPSVANPNPLDIPLRGPPFAVDALFGGAITADGQKRIGHFDMEDMALWHHFIKFTAATLATPWKEDLPQFALSCDYLMHGILATGALHLEYLRKDPMEKERYAYLASQHQDLAIGPFRRALASIGRENASHLFAFSLLLNVFNFASYRSPVLPFSDGTSYRGLPNWLDCLRGCAKIVHAASDHVEAGPLGFLVTRGREMAQALEAGKLPDPEVDKSFLLLEDGALNLQVIKSTTTSEEMEAYTDAIAKLRTMLAACFQGLDLVLRRSTISIWAGGVTDTFLRLLSEKRPPALIIMAHYCLLLKYCDECWYMERRSYHLFESVQQSLGSGWDVYVEYPRRVLSGERMLAVG